MASPGSSAQQPLDAIERVLFIANKVHVFAVPPLISSKGYKASEWTSQQPIFTARLRVFESSTTSSTDPSSENINIRILLEDPASGELFAAAPYDQTAAVTPCIDSQRFFALRVVDGGRKATLGVGFEARSEAFDFGIALQDAAKLLGISKTEIAGAKSGSQRGGATNASEVKKDYSLKEGETMVIKIGSKGRRIQNSSTAETQNKVENKASGQVPFLPPPPSAAEVRRRMEADSSARNATASADDNEFGDFQ